MSDFRRRFARGAQTCFFYAIGAVAGLFIADVWSRLALWLGNH